MKILFIGESWQGSSARSLFEALQNQENVCLAAVDVDLLVPAYSTPVLQLSNRLLRRLQIAELKQKIETACQDFQPDVIVVFKGWHFDSAFVRHLKQAAPAVNIFPDASPHAHGARLKLAMQEYDLVISTKEYHPPRWTTVYGYTNSCAYVPHGYSTRLHRRDEPVTTADFDVVMIASGRDEYFELFSDVFRRLSHRDFRYAIGGSRWQGRGLEAMKGVRLIGEKFGASYSEWLRKGKVVIAPVQTDLIVDGQKYPGDQVSTRSFECAAACCFFLHPRTPEAKSLYDEDTEVPMYDNAAELAEKIDFYISHPQERERIALAAHRRAVPAYSIELRAGQIVTLLRETVAGRRSRSQPLPQ